MVSVAVVAFSLAAFPPLALAKDDAAAAKARYESGVRHFDLSEYESALADFKDAYRSKPDPALLYNIAQCHRRLGHTDEAITFYRSYLRRAPDAKNREEVERRLSELETMRDAESATIANSKTSREQPSPVSPEAQKRAAAETTAVVPAAAIDFSPQGEPAPETSSAVYKRWWFWTAVGVVAAGAVTVAIVMAERDPTKIPASTLGAQKVLP